MDEISLATERMPVVNQIEWSPFGYSNEMVEYCRRKNIIIEAYSPLTRTKRLNEPLLTEIATTYNKTPAQLLIRWNIQHGVVPIPKATTRAHIQENSQVFDFSITTKDMSTLDSLNEYYSALSTLPYIKS
jgi:2,5-diketo-D-gluconate reductase A